MCERSILKADLISTLCVKVRAFESLQSLYEHTYISTSTKISIVLERIYMVSAGSNLGLLFCEISIKEFNKNKLHSYKRQQTYKGYCKDSFSFKQLLQISFPRKSIYSNTSPMTERPVMTF